MSALAAATPEKTLPPPAPERPKAFPREAPDLYGSVASLVDLVATSLCLPVGAAQDREEAASRVPFSANAVLTAQAILENKWYSGARTFEGAAHVAGSDEADEATRVAFRADLGNDSLVPRFEAMRRRGDLLKAFVGKGTMPVADWRPSAFYHHSCGGCGGRGRIPCNNCDIDGNEACPSFNCVYGQMTCRGCGGRGKTQYQDGSWHNCHGCWGNGKTNCDWCGGGCKIRCRSCRGAAWFDCQPCACTGEITQAHGFRIEAEHNPVVWMARCSTEAEGRAREWIAGGMRGAVDTPRIVDESVGSAPIANRSGAAVQPLVREAGKAPSFNYAVLGSFAEAFVVGKVEGMPFSAWSVRLERTMTGFHDAYFDAPAKEVAAALEASAAKGSPSGFARDAARYGGLGMLLGLTQGSGDGQSETAASVEALFAGAVSRSTVARIASAQAKCVTDFGKAAARAAWRWPNRLLLAAPIALVAMDLPWAAYSSHGYMGSVAIAGGGALAVILLLAIVAEALARHALRREVGSSKQYVPNSRGRRLALASAAACSALMAVPWAEINLPTLRSATHEFREIVGLPHVPCHDAMSPYADFCGRRVIGSH